MIPVNVQRSARVSVDDIYVSPRHRAIDTDAVVRIAASIEQIGLQHPITARFVHEYNDPVDGLQDNAIVLISGRHRLEAVKSLGQRHIECTLQQWDDTTSRMWEIAENLHRADLTAIERSEQISEYAKLVKAKRAAEVLRGGCAKPVGGRPEGGTRQASRDLGLAESEIRQSEKIAALSDDVKAAAVKAGMGDSPTRLLKLAALPQSEQIDKIEQIASEKAKPAKLAPEPLNDFETREQWISYMMRGWNRGASEWREDFLSRVDVPVFDKGVA